MSAYGRMPLTQSIKLELRCWQIRGKLTMVSMWKMQLFPPAPVPSGQQCLQPSHRANGGAPCGACRQVLAEFGLDTIVFVADAQGRIQQETTVKELLPGAFGPGDLPGY